MSNTLRRFLYRCSQCVAKSASTQTELNVRDNLLLPRVSYIGHSTEIYPKNNIGRKRLCTVRYYAPLQFKAEKTVVFTSRSSYHCS